MGKKLAIKGHPTRSKEVIELLEMMGGKAIAAKGDDETVIYVIPDNGIIDVRYAYKKHIDNYAIFTLEEFLEKYPFKVGDKVKDLKTDKIAEVYKMHWSENNSRVYYDIKYPNNLGCQRRLMDLQPYEKEINMKESTTLNMSAIDYNNGLVGYEIPEGYEFDTVIDNKVVLKKLKPIYPKTYKKCSKYLGLQHCGLTIDLPFNYSPLFISLAQLYICRNAYWKIAGEELGLNKPWEPDWSNGDETKFCIYTTQNIISLDMFGVDNRILAFPTEEMRDAFYENFKDLIEQCKELL